MDVNTETKQDNVISGSYEIKLAVFNNRDPEVWFMQAETAMRLKNIRSQSKKFDFIVVHLGESISEVRDLVMDPCLREKTDCYEILKTTLIERTTLSARQRLQKLLSTEDFGASKPSQTLRAMRNHLGKDSLSDDVIRTLFMQRLPSDVQSILAPLEEQELDKLAQAADRIIETRSGESNTHQVDVASKPEEPAKDSYSDILAELRKLTFLLKQQQHTRSESSARRPSRRSSFRHRSSSRSREADICWYHSRFAAKATKCIPPCSFKSTKSEN